MNTREMRRSWLVQRLSKPHPVNGSGPLAALGNNPFSFGGGLVNGGLSKDAMALLRPIISFEYMGAAEFEFGAVPEALSGLAKDRKRLAAGSFLLPLADVAPHWSDRSKSAPSGEVTIYTLCRKDVASDVMARIRGWAKGGYGTTKERVGLSDVLRPGEYAPDTCGWLELDNGFMFFTDRDMWASVCDLFGVKIPTGATA